MRMRGTCANAKRRTGPVDSYGMRIAILQMTSSIDPAINAAMLCEGIGQAASQGAAMLFAPEMAALVDRNRARAASHIVKEPDSLFVAAVRDAAKRTGVWVHLGSLPVCDDTGDGKWRNRSLVIDGQGAIRARYDKIHLFDIDLPGGESWRESAAYVPGESAVVVDTPLGLMGLAICYDLRFAALFDAYGAAGARIIVVPAAFTVPTGKAHWHALLRARAIEQGCFIIAAAQGGTHEDGRTTYGHSLVVDPWGAIIFDAGEQAALSIIDIDTDQVDAARAQLPAIQHRRRFTLPL